MIRTLFAARKLLCLAAVAACLLAAPSTAKAYWPYLGYPGNYGYTYSHGSAYIPAPPYFALYPPVYYSPYIQARHYGASPFAWYPGMEPIVYVDVYPMGMPRGPVMIENPYIAGAAPADQASTQTTPKVIENPFVAGATAQSRLIDNPYLASRK